MVRRDTSQKQTVGIKDLMLMLNKTLVEIQVSLFEKALDYQKEKTVEVDSWEEFVENIELGNFVRAYWDENPVTEEKIKQETKATIRCLPFTENISEGKCILSGNKASKRFIFAKSY